MNRMRIWVLVCLLGLLAGSATAAQVTGTLKNGGTTLTNGYTVWDLQGCTSPTLPDGAVPIQHVRLKADGTGIVNGVVPSTDRITCKGASEAPHFRVRAFSSNGVQQWDRLYQTPGATFDIGTATVYDGSAPGLPSGVTHTGTTTKFPGTVGIGTTPVAGVPLTLKLGTGTATGRVPAALYTLPAAAQTGANTDETVLATYTLPANTLTTNGQMLVLDVSGNVANNGNQKTIKVYFGSSSFFVANANTTANSYWHARISILRTGATTEVWTREYAIFAAAAASPLQPSAASINENLGTDLVIKVTGTNGTASAGDIVLLSARLVFL